MWFIGSPEFSILESGRHSAGIDSSGREVRHVVLTRWLGLIVLLLTLDDGAGRQGVAGLCQELVERLDSRGACFYPPKAEWGDPNEELV